jgi:transposase
MTDREQRGVSIAAMARIEKRDKGWSVPSQSGNGRYTVTMDGAAPHCTCPDHEIRGCKCKHIFAVECVIKRETTDNGDGSVKAHFMCGVKTNVVTAVEIHGRNSQDSPILPALLETTARNFSVSEVSADKGYSSINNADVVASYGATPFIAYKAGHTGKGGGVWEKMFHFFSYQRDTYLAHYHKRSNVESTVNMIKAKFSDHVRSKTDLAMKNEVLCKVLCHNICCLIHAMYELGISPLFGDDAAAQNVPALHKILSAT